MKKGKILLSFSLALAMILFTNMSALAATTNYTIRKGDTLWKIAKKYGVKWGDIAKENGIKNPRALQIGTVLKISTADTVVSKPTPSNETTSKETYKESTISIANGNYKVPAIVCMPEGKGPFPAVVMLHGTGSEKNEAGGGYKIAAHELAKAGIASIRIDFIGNGESKEDYINYNFTTAASDANAAANYMAGIETIDATRIGIMGWSQGGTIAMLAAGHNRSFQSVLTWSGAPDLSTMVTKENYETAKKDGYYNMTFEWRSSLKLGLKWFDEVYSTDVLKVFSNSDAPVLAINGTKDTDVDPSNAEKIAAASKNPNSKALYIDGADHTYDIFTGDMTHFNKLVAATVDWFSKTLKPAYTVSKINIKNGSRNVPAVIVTPVGKGPFPAVVINHGHGGSKDENGGLAGVAEALANKGILSIRMDFPGCGESTEPFTENYLSNMISDSNACLAYIQKNCNVDTNKLGIFGYSMGGRIALTIGEQKDSPYKAMGLLAPAADDDNGTMINFLGGKEKYDALYKEASEKGYVDFTTIFGQKQKLSLKWFDELKASTPIKNISNYKGSMLVVYGDKDITVSNDVDKAVIAAANAKSVVVPNADHGYGFYSDQPDVTAAVQDSFASFFVENLK